MKVGELVPEPNHREPFRRNRERFIPTESGCYVLTTFELEVLYVGLTNSLRRRMKEHLDNEAKRAITEKGRPIFFYWLEGEETARIERTWMATHLNREGALPILNKVFSPVSV
ncbi:MAG: GIY-YIG nuclease family protein [Betaproteobacteria bacterium]|jgi:predicted GIY-YIG superfamily endonuclease